MTPRLVVFTLIILIFLLSASEHRTANAGLPMINAAAPITQCTPPILDYSRRMVRLDGRSIA